MHNLLEKNLNFWAWKPNYVRELFDGDIRTEIFWGYVS